MDGDPKSLYRRGDRSQEPWCVLVVISLDPFRGLRLEIPTRHNHDADDNDERADDIREERASASFGHAQRIRMRRGPTWFGREVPVPFPDGRWRARAPGMASWVQSSLHMHRDSQQRGTDADGAARLIISQPYSGWVEGFFAWVSMRRPDLGCVFVCRSTGADI